MDLLSDEYYSIATSAEGIFKDQKSKFLSFAFPVESEMEVKEQLEKIRREYHDARHHCVAFRIGYDGAVWRASDDGEPSGTAGRPILGQIDSAALSDVAVVVVRYFGGIKLGVPGLIAAYKAATSDAIQNAQIIKKVAGRWYSLSYDYSQMPEVMKIVKEFSLPQRFQDFSQECRLQVRVRLSLEEDFLERINNLTNFKYEII